jgi:hypothetical protein
VTHSIDQNTARCRKNHALSAHRALLSSFVALTALLCAHVAHADGDPDAAETAAARTLAVDGVKLALADRCDEALDKLDRAEKLKHSPIVLRHLGECQVKLGRWVEGSESLRKLLREPQPEDASPSLEQAYESAATTLRDVKPRIPSMKIVVSAPRDAAVVVRVDGNVVADSVVGVALPADPGDHVVDVTAPGFLAATSSVKLAPSSNHTVALELKRDPSARPATKGAPTEPHAAVASAASKSAARPKQPAPAESTSSTGKTLGYVSYGVAALGLGVGVFFGQSAMKDEDALSKSCPNHVCSEEDRDSLKFAQQKGTIATIGFVTAGAGVALGTVLLLTAPSSSSSASAKAGQSRQSASTAFRPRAKIGLGNVTLATDF